MFAGDGGDIYTIYGDGTNLIDAMYVDDAIDAVRRMFRGHHWNATVNLAGGHPLTIEQLVREAATILGKANVDIRKEGVANESNRFWGSTSELKDALGFEARIGHTTGLQRFREFLLKAAAEGRVNG
jgi:nucleoside-diphosphate-sugar epimerase